MDKYLEVFAKQNPKMEFKCQADGCGRALLTRPLQLGGFFYPKRR